MMQVIAEMGARLFEKLIELKKAANRTKPAAKPISISGTPGSEATITGASTDAPTPRTTHPIQKENTI
jgi:hypothetical protein